MTQSNNKRGRGRPKKEGSVQEKPKSNVPKTHTVWTGTVLSVNVVDGKSFDPSFNKDVKPNSEVYLKRLQVEMKTTHGETIRFWSRCAEYRVIESYNGTSTATIQNSDWIKLRANSLIPAFKVGDCITVSGKIKTVWRGTTIINWVRLQEVIPQFVQTSNFEYQNCDGDAVVYLLDGETMSTYDLFKHRNYLSSNLSIDKLLDTGYIQNLRQGYALACSLANRQRKVNKPVVKTKVSITPYQGEQLALLSVN